MKDRSPETIAGLAVVRRVADLRRVLAGWRRAGERVALVPTMGALHAGHLALIEHGKRSCERVVASLFVNPTQFAADEDLDRYPRDEAADAAKLAAAACDLLYAPSVVEMYPDGFATSIDPGPIAQRQCGPFRPGHFGGVATVVAKLLLQAAPEIACFGEKDYQQLQVIRRVVRDLDIAVRIEGVPTVREADGLALSSRNVYLSAAERRVAPALCRVLARMAGWLRAGEKDVEGVIAAGIAELTQAGFTRVDYLDVADALTLRPLDSVDRPGRILGAAWLGMTRLIDNVPV